MHLRACEKTKALIGRIQTLGVQICACGRIHRAAVGGYLVW